MSFPSDPYGSTPGASGNQPNLFGASSEEPPISSGYAVPGYGAAPGYGGPPNYGAAAGYDAMPGGYEAPPLGAGGYPGMLPYGQPNNNLVWGILTTIFCFLPLGIVSIVKANQVNSKWQRGDVAGAYASARSAKRFAIASAIVSIVITAIAAVVIGVIVSQENKRNRSYYSYSTPTSYVPSYQSKSDIEYAIRGASYGDCFYRESSGSTLSMFVKVSCSQYKANVKVTKVTTSTSNCSGNWVRSDYDSSYSTSQVVLCLTSV
ncbi:hypothetical protein MINS_30390 [Mycolicibacterium insubricum]|jgi:hypothetical protein|uniref:Uncharacterized protein n=1 Tax=Mycolicibacterium insubricum TaxID=444597 RepID=A0A1X0DIW2_9MYCO|nr:CD225/dispanin family protein [Mycolicibacterium insubricum]ORA72321.1 hypothetical protein BST26_05190 [Mycolicibacterium insubricum]BBZ67610.1 hypothetical protein MINS_30390 [Mycolicibacterium insubricum]